MGVGAVPVVLTFLLVFFALRVVYTTNKDLVRAKAWGELARRVLPFAAIAATAASLPLLQNFEDPLPIAWVLTFGAVLVLSNFLSVPIDERRASRAFRDGDYVGAAALYRKLVEKRPLARYWTFLGAALGAGEHHDEAIDASTKAVELDPKYGLAYYKRALILRKMGRKRRAAQDHEKSLDADLPRRFRTGARKELEELRK
ncbi:MAG TPA: tetratricopeptide repeat protein [Rubrobacteraceae bacterium]|nr:tetratricopeptide repeat protein [Rubrobacteraceae bacterium]